MAQSNIFSRYGLKEVSNVSIFALDNEEKTGIKKGDLVLYLDSLKVSTIEQTADNTEARGGWGNPRLIMWDYGKEITLTLEDALLSPEFLRIMAGGSIKRAGEKNGEKNHTVAINFVSRNINFNNTDKKLEDQLKGGVYDTHGTLHKTPEKYSWINLTTGDRGSVAGEGGEPEFKEVSKDPKKPTEFNAIRIFWSEEKASEDDDAVEIVISPDTFPGTYKFVGDTFIRSEATGKDEPFQWVIPKAKISSEVSFTMEAEGDPATFEFTVNVLRGENEETGEYEMMKWIKYNIEDYEENKESSDADSGVSTSSYTY